MKDDEDNNIITAGSIVTVTVTLHRRNMGSLLDSCEKKPVEEDAYVEDEGEETQVLTASTSFHILLLCVLVSFS